jgi:hypothetical protein
VRASKQGHKEDSARDPRMGEPFNLDQGRLGGVGRVRQGREADQARPVRRKKKKRKRKEKTQGNLCQSVKPNQT